MKKTILLILFLYSAHFFSQIAVKAIHIRPTGELGMTMKPTFSGEVFYKDFEEESSWKPRFGLGFIKFTPRLDTFPVTGLIVSQTTTVSPGYMTYQKYNLFYLYGGLDYKIKIFKSFSVYPGFDINFGSTSVQYEAKYPLISDEGYQGGSVYIGLRLRTGFEYQIKEKAAVFIEAVRNMNLIPHEAFMAYNDYGIGFRFNFSK